MLRYVLALEVLVLIILAFTGFLYERRARDRDLRISHAPGKLVDIGGYRLHISCEGSGSGPTVVLEYGHQASYLDWYLVQPEIANFARVCFYDRAGYGWSDPSPQPRGPSVMAGEVAPLLQPAGGRAPFFLVSPFLRRFHSWMLSHKFHPE